jgi:hypothetical protein
MHLVDDGSDSRRTLRRRRQSIEDHFMPLENPISPGTLTLGQVLE